MGEANRDGVAEILLSIRSNPTKLAPKFSEFLDSEPLDLNLGLSLGGFYSQIPKENPLIRTSSLNIDLSLAENNEVGGGGFLSLARSASLPTKAEQEMRKIKEIQALKRMEAKRRLLEKQRHSRGGAYDQEEKLSNLPFEKLTSNACSSTNPGFQGRENSAAAKVPTLSQPAIVDSTNYRSAEKPENGKQIISPPISHPNSTIPFLIRANGKPVEIAETVHERLSKKVKVLGNHTTTPMEMWKQMPSVTTIGDGPNGKRIEGLLYRYRKGQVSIVCICHGNFLSPAEFVKHAGGTDVANPMKHINVLATTI
ncbi:ninja-family protein AFP3-like [Actinidia eriantha]|uniref:ninja-family protein AFP3-like n=1 Tax=Actinidia eriantha TaxID=165200 RepID=UPI002590FD37|nr:ninja-family protein AFP3-like [Actinidia eriantha]XP_057459830.1 ninja-family protein AFP3-like [Actinidia eriantha]